MRQSLLLVGMWRIFATSACSGERGSRSSRARTSPVFSPHLSCKKMVESGERKERGKTRKDGDEDEWKCKGVGSDDLWLGDAGRSATDATSGQDRQCSGTRSDGLVAQAIGGACRHQSGLPLPGECTDEL